jgi:GTP-binding protein
MSDAPRSPLASVPIEFLGSFPDPAHPLLPSLPEFAFVGRSNAGKSSLLNALTGRRALARVSQTPGKTQLLNIFRLPSLYLIDLPGYGFAQASQGARKAYRALLEAMLTTRSSLTGVIWLLDIRHTPSADDVDFQTLLATAERNVLVVLTKADKMTRNQQNAALTLRARELGVATDQIQVVSARTGQGIADLAESMLAAGLEPA